MGEATTGSAGRVAAFFDLDKTVIDKPAMVAFAKPLYDAGYITRTMVVRAAYTNLRYRGVPGPERMVKFRAIGLRIVTGWNAAEVRQLVEASIADRIEPLIYPGALAVIRRHQRAGHQVFLVSAEPDDILRPIADLLDIEHTISSRAVVGADGCYTGEAESWIYGAEKETAIREVAERLDLDLDASFAYSDSATDIPMLSSVGHGVVINPDAALEREALARGWEIRRFDHSTPDWRAATPFELAATG